MNNKWVITIGREFCSGGAETGHKVAEILGISYHDKIIIDETAERLHLSPTVVKQHDEKPAGVWTIPGFQYGNHWYMDDPSLVLPLSLQIADTQFNTIRRFANDGPCVVVGRCADYVLRSRPNVLNVFIRADLGKRIERAMRLYGIEVSDAKKLIKRTDKIRANYYESHTNQKWGSPANYQLVLDTGRIGVNTAADIITAAVESLDKKETIIL
jgi:cytidylate kinase